MICISCNEEHDGNFCPNCGEKAQVPKITFRSILNDAARTVTNMDKGFLFNIKNLFFAPKTVVIDYLQGKRKKIFNPISFLIISVTIYIIGESFFKVQGESTPIDSKIYSIGYEAGKFIQSYFKYFWILSIIWLSISTRLIFGKYNFAEHLAINAFVVGQTTLVGLIWFLIFRTSLFFNPIVYFMIFSD